MKSNIEEMITLNYELEGLLYLALHRGDETPRQVWDMISSKIEALREGLAIDKGTDDKADNPEYTHDAEATATLIKEEELEAAELEPAEDPSILEEPDIEETSDVETVDCIEPLAEAVSDCIEPAETMEAETIEAETSEDVEAIETSETITEPKQQEKLPTREEPAAEAEPIRLDEKLARENSRNLKKAFSLNDKFRFRRELFNNSDKEMSEAIDAIESMPSLADALTYCYSDLQWDKNNQNVIDFIDIITHHFSGK